MDKETTSYEEGLGFAEDLREELRDFFLDEEYGLFERQWFMRGLKEGLETFDG